MIYPINPHRSVFSVPGCALSVAALGLLCTMSAQICAKPLVGVESAELELVVVTARRREESVLDVPVAVSVLSEEQLRQVGIRNLEDLSASVPGLELTRTNTGNAARIYIRGIGQRDPRTFVDPAVGLYVDDVYISRADGALMDILDVAKIEVLRGPQGALFGKNTVGGAIRIFSALPEAEPSAFAQVRLGEYRRRDWQLGASGPLGAHGAGSINLSQVFRDGYMHNPLTGRRYSDEQRWAVRGQYYYTPDDRFSLRAIVGWGRQREAGAGAHCVLAEPRSGTLGGSPLGQALEIDTACLQSSSSVLSGDQTLINAGEYNLDTQALTLIAKWRTESFGWSSVSGVRRQKLAYVSDQDGSFSQAIGLRSLAPDQRQQLSQEFQFRFDDADRAYQLLAGLYLFDEQTRGEELAADIGPGGVSLLSEGPMFDTYVLGSSRDNVEIDVTSYAAFSQLIWDMNARWQLTLGLRYTWENRKLTALQAVLDPDAITANDGAVGPQEGRPKTPNGGLVRLPAGARIDSDSVGYGDSRSPCGLPPDSCRGEQTWRQWTPSATLSYRWPDNGPWPGRGTAYATVGQGFKAGAINLLRDQISLVEPETVINYELGLKMTLLDGRLQLATAVFRADYDDIQVPVAIPPLGLDLAGPLPGGIADTGLVNAAQARIRGLELEFRWHTGLGFRLNANLSYIDARYLEFADPFGAGDRKDESFSGIPRWSTRLGAQFALPLAGGLFTPGLDYHWQSSVSHHFGHSSFECRCYRQGAHGKLNLRLAWAKPDGSVEIAAYATNLANKQTFYGASPLVDIIGGGPTFVDAPRMLGVELRRQW